MFAKIARFPGLGHRHAARRWPHIATTIIARVARPLLCSDRRGAASFAAGGPHRGRVGSNAFGKMCQSVRKPKSLR